MSIRSSLVHALTVTLLAIGIPTPAAAQQHVEGRCNAVIGDGSDGNNIFINCPNGGVDGLFGTPFGERNESVLVLNARVNGLAPGRRQLEITVQNLDSGSSRARIIPAQIRLSDDLGYTYGLDCLNMAPMFCVREMFISAGRTVRLPLILDQPIHPESREVYFSIEDIWVGSSGTSRMHPMGAVEWSVSLSSNPSLSSDFAAQETSLGLGPSTKQDIQRALNAQGYNAGPVDGAFGPQTRAAIAAWQEASGYLPNGYLDGSQARELKSMGFRLKVENMQQETEARMRQNSRNFDQFQRDSERVRRQMDADFERRWGRPPPNF